MNNEPTLLQVVLDPKSKRLEAVVRDHKASKNRRISITWQSRDPMPLPKHWWEDIVDESDFQRALGSGEPRAVFRKIRHGG